MGGDHGPKATIEGVQMASKIYPHVRFKLFGNKEKSEDQLNKFLKDFEFFHTDESIKSDDEPVTRLEN